MTTPRSDHFSYLRSLCLLFSLTVLFLSGLPSCWAATQSVVQTGDLADGAAVFARFSAPTINQLGAVAFTAELSQGVGGVSADNGEGIWRLAGNSLEMIAREGSGNVPGVAGGDFASFPLVALGNSGDILVRAKLREGVAGVTGANGDGLWRFGSTGELLERTDTTAAAGVSSAVFRSLGATPVVSANGVVSMASRLKLGSTVNSDNDRGVWLYANDQASLAARESTTAPPGIGAGSFLVFTPLASNDPGVSVVFADLRDAPVGSQQGLWSLSTSGNELIAQRGVTPAPGTSGEVYESLLEAAAINNNGSVAFRASLRQSASVDATNDSGVWLSEGASASMLARTGVGNVPGAPGADFAVFSAPQLNDHGATLLRGELAVGIGGVAATDAVGLWQLNPTAAEGQLIARTGSGGTPGVVGASFSDFLAWDQNNSGQIAFTANLEAGIGGVTNANNEGLWFVDPNGDSQLIARTGDQLAGQTIASLQFAGGETQGTSGLNDAGQIAFLAEFTSGASGLFLFNPTVSFLADFDNSHAVDGDDLVLWQSGYGGESLVADANGDNSADGADFLIWQRELAGPAPSAANVPAPSSLALALAAFCYGLLRRRG